MILATTHYMDPAFEPPIFVAICIITLLYAVMGVWFIVQFVKSVWRGVHGR